jgi:hypothetical protein
MLHCMCCHLVALTEPTFDFIVSRVRVSYHVTQTGRVLSRGALDPVGFSAARNCPGDLRHSAPPTQGTAVGQVNVNSDELELVYCGMWCIIRRTSLIRLSVVATTMQSDLYPLNTSATTSSSSLLSSRLIQRSYCTVVGNSCCWRPPLQPLMLLQAFLECYTRAGFNFTRILFSWYLQIRRSFWCPTNSFLTRTSSLCVVSSPWVMCFAQHLAGEERPVAS